MLPTPPEPPFAASAVMRGSPAIHKHRLHFSGRGGEFFRVWLVNVLLTVLTFSLYTPFARKRTASYFYSHTTVAGSPLEFSASQRKMFFGFLLFIALYLAFDLAGKSGYDWAPVLFMFAGAALAPFIWGSAMRFRLRSTRWRGVRLAFVASWREVYRASWPVFAIAAIWAVLIWLALAWAPLPTHEGAAPAGRLPAPTQALPAVGLFLLASLASLLCLVRLDFNYKRLLVTRARIGAQFGHWKASYGDFVRIWLATVGLALLALLILGALSVALIGGALMTLGAEARTGHIGAILFILAITLFFGFAMFFVSAPARAYREARVFHLMWNQSGISHIARFKCKLGIWRFVGLRVKNMLLTLITLGFYRPFALVSEYRMKVESVALYLKGPVDQLEGQLVHEQGGLADAIADAVGLDIIG